MTRYSKFNIIYRLQKWLDSVPGQTFLNYAYSWGAAVVILGALFKLTHQDGANLMLYIGMGTEVIVFFLSGFDRPFDKTEIGKDLPIHVTDDEEEPLFEPKEDEEGVHITEYAPIEIANAEQPAHSAAAFAGQGTSANTPALSADVAEATGNYIEQLQKLTDVLAQVSEQSQRLTRDSEEMENLNRTLTGISRVYEMQLKSASNQISTIDEINEQTNHLAQQIQELNQIYARMIEAMTTNVGLRGA
ncbi:MAG: gliding motility protein GldL [Prevotella sp.]|nr:gliding motility protein GldL [Prevotella sp.]MCF0208582.1 gliding motility protein GldL [Bacteroidaceae bacterium]